MAAEPSAASADAETRILQEERDRIAKAIHDGVSQNLALLMLKMEVISRLADVDPPRMKAEISKAVEILEASVRELRNALYSLRTPEVEGADAVRSTEAVICSADDERGRSAPNSLCG